MKLFIDDLRDPPDDSWVVARSSVDAINLLGSGTYDWISFDHDLGGDDTTRPVVLWIIENGVEGFRWTVHSMNPVGRDWLVGMLRRYCG